MNLFKIIDGHCDTLTHLLDESTNLESPRNHINIQKLIEGGVYLQFFAAWIGPRRKYGLSLQRGLRLIETYLAMLDSYSNLLTPILGYSDLDMISANRIGCLLSIEGGDILEGELSNLKILHKLGVRAITLTWNNRNEIGDGIMEENSLGGLSDFGLSVVGEMNRLNMLIDVSHLGVKGFWDAIEHSSEPIIASHSNAKSICNNVRNLEDEQILALSKIKGLIGINFYPPFLSEDNASIDDIISNIEYIAALVGTDAIGFGSDFDGIESLPAGIRGPQDFPKVIERLLQLNYPEEDIKKICSENFIRIIRKVLK